MTIDTNLATLRSAHPCELGSECSRDDSCAGCDAQAKAVRHLEAELVRLRRAHDAWRDRALQAEPKAETAEHELARIQHLHHLAEIEARDLRRELARLQDGLREMAHDVWDLDTGRADRIRALLADTPDGAA